MHEDRRVGMVINQTNYNFIAKVPMAYLGRATHPSMALMLHPNFS